MKTAYEVERKARRDREARARLIAANPGQHCPPEHRHAETTTCYSQHGCRCTPCRKGRQAGRRRADWEANRMKGRDVWVPALGAQRRLQALAYMGWSPQAIAEKTGSHYRPVLKIRSGERVRVRLSTHRRIEHVFAELATVQAPGHSGVITRGNARLRGFAPPLAWDDIDDPAERPKGLA